MPTPESLLLLFLTSLALALSPGPDNLYVLSRSAIHGWRTGMIITFGLMTGLCLHTLAASVGISALLAASPAAMTVLQWLGAGYLAWLGIEAIRSKAVTSAASLQEPRRSLYLRGLLMNLSNPKVVLFFLAFLPQFVTPENGSPVLQLAILGSLFIVAALLVFTALSVTAGSLQGWLLERPHIHLGLHRVSGIVLISLALHLLWSELPL